MGGSDPPNSPGSLGTVAAVVLPVGPTRHAHFFKDKEADTTQESQEILRGLDLRHTYPWVQQSQQSILCELVVSCAGRWFWSWYGWKLRMALVLLPKTLKKHSGTG
jgi:hypothetical protein